MNLKILFFQFIGVGDEFPHQFWILMASFFNPDLKLEVQFGKSWLLKLNKNWEW
jgi:hypothetical protein